MTDDNPVRSVTVELHTSCRATPDAVWNTLVDDIDAWWGAPYVRSAERTALTLDARPGGQLVEAWGDHGGAVWATVSAVREPNLLSFDGTFMMSDALAGTVDITITADHDMTTIAVTQRALGAISDETLNSWRQGWIDLLAALVSHAHPDSGTTA
jgi:uncharacterized protein YndB with AHSA1/START domain